MENLSHTVAKKICNYNVVCNGLAAKTVYDDVFGGPPKFGMPTFSPRAEDYSDIFGGFFASRGLSTIPLLDLPAVDETEVCFDIRSSMFDYSEVFGGFNCFDFTVSSEELFDQSNGSDESSEEAWTPAETESLSENSAPSAYSGRNPSLSNGDSHQSFDGVEQFNISHHEANPRSNDDMLNGTHIIVDEIIHSQMMELRNAPSQVIDDINLNFDFIRRDIGGKHFRKTMSHPSNSTAGINTLRKDIKSLKSYSQNGSHHNEAFLTVSEISLRTHPSHLLPPSRPPPIRKRDSGGLASDLEGITNYAFGGIAGDSSPPFFDVEVDASSSATASAAAMKEAVLQAQAKLRSAKELIERKKEGLQSRAKLGSKSDIKDNKAMIAKMVDGSNNFNEKRVHGTHEEEHHGLEFLVGEERQKVTKNTLGDPYFVEGEEFFDAVQKSTEKRHGKEICSSLESYKTDGSEQLEENDMIINLAREAFELEENEKKLKASEETQRQEHQKKVDAAPEISKQKEVENNFKIAYEHRETKKNLAAVDVWNEFDVVLKVQPEENYVEFEETMKQKENNQKLKISNDRIENDNRIKEVRERRENGKRLKDTFEQEEIEERLKQDRGKDEFEKWLKEVREQEEIEKKQKEAHETEEDERRLKEALELEENEKRLFELEENEKKLKEATEREENEKKLKEALEKEANGMKHKEARQREEFEMRRREHLEREEVEKRQREACKREENENRSVEAQKRQESEKIIKEVNVLEGTGERLRQCNTWEEGKKSIHDGFEGVKSKGIHEDIMRDENEKILKLAQGTRVQMETETLKAADEAWKLDVKKNLQEDEHVENRVNLEATEEISVEEVSEKMSTERKDGESVVEAVENASGLSDDRFDASGMVQVDLQAEEIHISGVHAIRSVLDESVRKSGETFICTGQTGVEENINESQMAFDPKYMEEKLTHELGERGKNIGQRQVAFDLELSKYKFRSTQMVNEGIENGKKIGRAPSSMSEGGKNTKISAQHVITSQSTESKRKNNEDLKLEERDREREERMKRDKKLEQDRLRKLQEDREREREREKDRMAVERATREVRERACAESRERAAVERATAEARQRAMAEARERLEKEGTEAREKSLAEKVSMEARIRAERAAVERATAEVRDRAVGKAMAEKTAFEAREGAERSASSSSSKYPYSSTNAGAEVESAQRCKARLERHQRTDERAAKALAEKISRDCLAQREQAERNRLAEYLDADVKRWSSGKEGNMRALLSTLQYILGPDSSWQPIPLTGVITAPAVKKAYKKATLCVHPDKLQQRGASIQQKYICEKVFDLLKEAWNKFNSEER